jgi:hypothetical protein
MSTPLPTRTGRIGWAFFSVAKVPYEKSTSFYEAFNPVINGLKKK